MKGLVGRSNRYGAHSRGFGGGDSLGATVLISFFFIAF